jgi:orotate phosphoribosyltransferase
MQEEDVLDLFRRSGALLEGHFRLTSGLHSQRYLQSALVLQYPEFADTLGHELAERTRHLQPTAVLSPALGGIVIGQEVARSLGSRALFAERQDGALTLRRGFGLGPAARVAEGMGAQVVGAAAIIDRSGGASRLELPLQALVRLEVPTYPPDACPLCERGVPLVKPGSRA